MSNESHKDIDSIFDYISKDSIRYANETVNNIYSRIYELENNPYSGRYVPEFPSQNYKELIYKSYRIVYEIYDTSNTIYIHCVVHGKRNFKKYFKSYIKDNFNSIN